MLQENGWEIGPRGYLALKIHKLVKSIKRRTEQPGGTLAQPAPALPCERYPAAKRPAVDRNLHHMTVPLQNS